MTRNNQREKFDPGREFSVLKRFRCEGLDLAPGEAFDKQRVNVRRLHQLYDQKYIEMLADDFAYASPVEELIRRRPAGRPDFAAMSMDELRNYLAGRGVVARLGWDRGKLLNKIALAA